MLISSSFAFVVAVTGLTAITSTPFIFFLCCSQQALSGKLHCVCFLTHKTTLFMMKKEMEFNLLNLITQGFSVIILQFLGVLFIYGLYSQVNQILFLLVWCENALLMCIVFIYNKIKYLVN